jgi:hypothetical protein
MTATLQILESSRNWQPSRALLLQFDAMIYITAERTIQRAATHCIGCISAQEFA